MKGVKMFKNRQFSLPLMPVWIHGEPKLCALMFLSPVNAVAYVKRSGWSTYGIPRNLKEA